MDPLTERLLAQDADTAANGPYQAQVLCAYPDCNRTRRPVNIPRSDYELALRRHKPDMVRGRTLLFKGTCEQHDEDDEDDMGRASLRGADLSRADLSDANLSGANLGGANLTDTIF